MQPARVEPLRLREWTIHEVIGRGAMGVVRRATHSLQSREFAIKILGSDLAGKREERVRFLREAAAAASLRHPNVVETLLPFEEDGALFLPMELLRGRSLYDLMRARRRPWPIGTAAAYVAQAAAGIGCAHDAGILHRDITIGNLFVLEDGWTVKVLDFGLAKGATDQAVTTSGTLMGTPQYLAPEILSGEPASSASDVYALGIVLFRLLTGDLPFKVSDYDGLVAMAMAIKDAQEEGLPWPSEFRDDLPPELDLLTGSLLDFDADARPGDGNEVAERLAAFVPARPGGLPSLDAPPKRRSVIKECSEWSLDIVVE